MGTDHDFYIVLASKYPQLRSKFTEYFGPKDGQNDIAQLQLNSLHSESTKQEIYQKLLEAFKASLNKDKDEGISYEKLKQFEQYLKANTLHVKSIRNYLLKNNLIDSFEYYTVEIGLNYSVSTKSQIKSKNMNEENEATELLSHILQMIDNIGELAID